MLKRIRNRTHRLVTSILCRFSIVWGSKYLYNFKTDKHLDLKQPKSFNEKLMWLKIYRYSKSETVWNCADKYKMRDYAIKSGCNPNILIDLLGIYNRVKDIEWDKFPDKFVIKCTHGCGFNIVCQDKNTFDIKEAEKKLSKWLKTKFGYKSAELHYTHVKPKIICEKFIESEKHNLPTDYKFYCFNGEPKVILVCNDRDKNRKSDFFNMNWDVLVLRDNNTNTEKAKEIISRPEHFDEMVKNASILSKAFEFVRIDFYDSKDTPILGEMTFTPAACTGYYNEKGDSILSNMLDINIDKRDK